MRPHNYTTGLVTQQYYYYYHSLPYFESKYIAEHDCMYDPEKTTSRASTFKVSTATIFKVVPSHLI